MYMNMITKEGRVDSRAVGGGGGHHQASNHPQPGTSPLSAQPSGLFSIGGCHVGIVQRPAPAELLPGGRELQEH